MSRIIVICGSFPVYDRAGLDTGRKVFCASHGIEEDTMREVALPNDHPVALGAKFDHSIMEWVIE